MLRSVLACGVLIALVSAAPGKPEKGGPVVQPVDLKYRSNGNNWNGAIWAGSTEASELTKEEILFYRYCVKEFGKTEANRMLLFILSMKKPNQGMMNGQYNGMLNTMD